MFNQDMIDIYKSFILPMLYKGYKVIIDKEKETLTFIKEK